MERLCWFAPYNPVGQEQMARGRSAHTHTHRDMTIETHKELILLHVDMHV